MAIPDRHDGQLHVMKGHETIAIPNKLSHFYLFQAHDRTLPGNQSFQWVFIIAWKIFQFGKIRLFGWPKTITGNADSHHVHDGFRKNQSGCRAGSMVPVEKEIVF